MLLREFHLLIKDKKRSKNIIVDHLSRIVCECTFDKTLDLFLDEHLFALEGTPSFADIVNNLVTKELPNDWSKVDRRKMKENSRYYFWGKPYLLLFCSWYIIGKYSLDKEQTSVLSMCHDGPCEGHLFGNKTTRKIFKFSYFLANHS